MYVIALISLVCAMISALLAYFWHRAPRSTAEHWTMRRKRAAKVRAGKMGALYLGATAIVLGGIAQIIK
jgi:UDP-N-acetylmuramyl pentapeptide phosphotransferase/UDP-N-acetylglucosamine-1-phosphate transferase